MSHIETTLFNLGALSSRTCVPVEGRLAGAKLEIGGTSGVKDEHLSTAGNVKCEQKTAENMTDAADSEFMAAGVGSEGVGDDKWEVRRGDGSDHVLSRLLSSC